jgi:hypothetical protein
MGCVRCWGLTRGTASPEAVASASPTAAAANYAGAFEIVRASRLGRVFTWLGTLVGTPVASRAGNHVEAFVRVRPEAQGVTWDREYRWADGARHVVRSTKVVDEHGKLVEKLPARLCMPLDTYEEGGVLHFVSRGYYFDLRFGDLAPGIKVWLPRLLSRRHPRRTHRPRPRLVPLHDDRHSSDARRGFLPDRALLRHRGAAMTLVFSLLTVQTLLGALDTIWNHEIAERLPGRRAARHEQALHAGREFIYAFLFLALAGANGTAHGRRSSPWRCCWKSASPSRISWSKTARAGCPPSSACCTPC